MNVVELSHSRFKYDDDESGACVCLQMITTAMGQANLPPLPPSLKKTMSDVLFFFWKCHSVRVAWWAGWWEVSDKGLSNNFCQNEIWKLSTIFCIFFFLCLS